MERPGRDAIRIAITTKARRRNLMFALWPDNNIIVV
jgi:hypothetical protein